MTAESLAGLVVPDTAPPADPVTEDVPAADPLGRRARVTWASEIDYEPPVFAWVDEDEGRIPVGSLSIAAGREATGKSSFGIWMAAQLTRGTLPGEFHGTPRNVLYVAVEDSWRWTLVPRMLAAGADLSRVGRFDVVVDEDTEVTLSLPTDNDLLEAEITKHGVVLVVIDPLMSTLGAGIDTHRERDVRRALDPLARMADRTGAVLLGIAHFGKGGGTDAASLITGSGAFKNVPRSVFGFARDDTDEDGGRVMTQVKNSANRDDLPSRKYKIVGTEVPTPKGVARAGVFVFTGTSTRSVEDVLREAGSAESADDRDEAEEWLFAYLADQPNGEAPAGEVIKAAEKEGIAKHTIQRVRKRAGVLSRKATLPNGEVKGTPWVWALPDTKRDNGRPGGAPSDEGSGPKVTPKNTKNTEHGGLSPSSSSVSPSIGPSPSTTAPVVTNGDEVPAVLVDLLGARPIEDDPAGDCGSEGLGFDDLMVSMGGEAS